MTDRPIGVQRLLAKQAINEAAEEARLRSLTGLAGQDMVYAEKLAQALAYVAAHAADSQAPVPAYVAADVAAVGGTALAASQAIIAAAAAFHEGPGPDIEQARRAGNAAVLAATTAESVEAAKAAALDALMAI